MTRREINAVRAGMKAKAEAARQEAIRVVASGRCPLCGAPLYHNSAMAGWWQCEGYPCREMRHRGFEHLPKCNFQCFTR